MALPPARKLFLKWPVIYGPALAFYASVIFVLILYIGALAFLCARYLSTPWVQQSYISDYLPWYVRAIYWEKLPSILKITMWQRRMLRAYVLLIMGRRAMPYEVQVGIPKESLISELWKRWKRVVKFPWFSTQDKIRLSRLPHDYTDDYYPLGEAAPRSSDLRTSPTTSSLASGVAETGLFDSLGQENALVLRAIQRALMATQSDDKRGYSMRDGMRDSTAALQFLLRVGKRRRLKDVLFDIGIFGRRR